jgi:hypothetical protein
LGFELRSGFEFQASEFRASIFGLLVSGFEFRASSSRLGISGLGRVKRSCLGGRRSLAREGVGAAELDLSEGVLGVVKRALLARSIVVVCTQSRPSTFHIENLMIYEYSSRKSTTQNDIF